MDDLTRELVGSSDVPVWELDGSTPPPRDRWSEQTWADRTARSEQWRRDRQLIAAIRRWDAHLQRLVDAEAAYTRLEAYRCRHCHCWHVGHRPPYSRRW